MLSVRGISKAFPAGRGAHVAAVNDVSFEVGGGEFFSLLGPSGCGKTTLLRMIAGLETPDSGEIWVDGLCIYSSASKINLASSQRRLGLVFQSFAIWPHMSVLQNVTFPLDVLRRQNGWSRSDIVEKAMAVLRLVSLDDLAGQGASVLSGGQKQRLAVARAIVAEPKLILFDEPLSNLDAKLRDRMRRELRDLQAALGITFLYVTHDQDEALSLSRRVAVMNKGEIQQIGTPDEVYRRPENEFVSEFIGKGTVLEGALAKLVLGANGDAQSGRAMARPEDIALSASRETKSGWHPCKLVSKQYFGDHWDIVVEHAGQLVTVRAGAHVGSSVGADLFIRYDPEKLISLT